MFIVERSENPEMVTRVVEVQTSGMENTKKVKMLSQINSGMGDLDLIFERECFVVR